MCVCAVCCDSAHHMYTPSSSHTIIITHRHHHTPSSRTKFMPARRHAACAHETHPFHPRSSVTDKRQSRVGLLMALIAPVAARTHMSPTCTARRAVHPAPPLPAFPRSSMPAIHRIAPRPPGKECAHSVARLQPSDRLLPHIAAHTSAHSPCTACLQPHKLPRRQPKSSPPRPSLATAMPAGGVLEAFLKAARDDQRAHNSAQVDLPADALLQNRPRAG